jgi:carboxymethylenebutenolidase
MLSNAAFDAIGSEFARRGWIFFAPYRRGQGLSAAAGLFIGDEIASARQHGAIVALPFVIPVSLAALGLIVVIMRKKRAWIRGTCIALVVMLTIAAVYLNSIRAGAETMVRLLETDHLDDQIAAYDWLRLQDFVQSDRIAVAGNSFGGIQAVLGAERLNYCAAIDAAGGAESWMFAPALKVRMISAAQNSKSPIFFFQAENDHSLAPSLTLSAVMRDAGKVSALKIYPAFGRSASDGHSFTWLGTAAWADDVFAFLNQNCRN